MAGCPGLSGAGSGCLEVFSDGLAFGLFGLLSAIEHLLYITAYRIML